MEAKTRCNGVPGAYCDDCGFRFFCFTNLIKLEPQPHYGDLMTVEDFIKYCQAGGFIDSDGIGYYATRHSMTRITAHPSDMKKGNIDGRWSHVMWFNK